MQQLTYTDILRMEDVLAEARHILAEAEEIALGVKVRITIHSEDKGPITWTYSARVATYAAQCMGAAAAFPEAPKVVFFTQGAALVTQPSINGYRAFIEAILAHHYANQRRTSRLLRKHAAVSQKGGQTGE